MAVWWQKPYTVEKHKVFERSAQQCIITSGGWLTDLLINGRNLACGQWLITFRPCTKYTFMNNIASYSKLPKLFVFYHHMRSLIITLGINETWMLTPSTRIRHFYCRILGLQHDRCNILERQMTPLDRLVVRSITDRMRMPRVPLKIILNHCQTK